MATEITSDNFSVNPSDTLAEEAALQNAHAQAVSELNRIREKASLDDSTQSAHPDYSVHEVSGLGKYVIPRHTGWKPLLRIIHDPVPNIDFSANIYPNFDGIIGEHFQSPYLLDPLDDKFQSYESLRDNLAAVRNFLMQTYYANTPAGMTPEKARKSLEQIAAFVGDGLNNNWLYFGLIPNHKWTGPFIDLKTARKKNGHGAQYIYEKILEHQRHSSWLRPFDKVIAMFGGSHPPDWQLPPADSTPFNERQGKDLVGDEPTATDGDINAATARVDALEARMQRLRDRRALGETVGDLDAIGNHLLYTAQNMEGVAHLSEPLRRDAVDIAKDILRKLKFSIGNLNIIDGLNLKPSDDLAALGAVKGVATVYERLLAWARGNNDTTIFQHPSILAATQAIGQMGYLAKLEALRIATIAGNNNMIGHISEQLQRIPDAYRNTSDVTFGTLLNKIEQGIDTVLNRTQEVSVSGAMVGKSVDNRGSSMDAAPTAGNANLVGDQHTQRNAEMLAAQQLASLAQAQRVQAQAAQQQQNASRTTGAVPGRTQNQQQGRKQRTQNTSTSTTAPSNPALNEAQRKAAAFAAQRATHEHEEQQHHADELLRQQALIAQQKAAALAKAKAAATAVKAFDMKGVTGAPITGGRRPIDPKTFQINVNAAAAKQPAPAATPPGTAPKPTVTNVTQEELKNPYAVQPPPPPPRGGGRGF